MIKPHSGPITLQRFFKWLAARPAAALAATLAVAFIGGLIAAMLGLPVAWLTGAMTACAIIAAAGAPMRIPEIWRLPVFVVLGISMGSGVTPEALELARTWPLSLVALAVAVPVMVSVSVMAAVSVTAVVLATAAAAGVAVATGVACAVVPS